MAHPHVFVDTSFNISLSNKSAPVVEVTWSLDEMSSMTLIMDYDQNGDGTFDAAEEAFFKKEEFDSLKANSYFTYLHADGKALQTTAPADFRAFIEENRIIYRFTLQSATPLQSFKALKVACYDPENYMAMFISDEDTTITGLKPMTREIVMEEMDNFVADILLLKVSS
jgi:ABC-type uncharacterized transport system substrate-binding protein